MQRAAAPVERRLLGEVLHLSYWKVKLIVLGDDAFMVWKKAYHRKAFLVRST